MWRRPLRWGWAFRFAFTGSAVLARTAANARTSAASSQLGSGGRLISGHPLGPQEKSAMTIPGWASRADPAGQNGAVFTRQPSGCQRWLAFL
jgi:hypothetical protein